MDVIQYFYFFLNLPWLSRKCLLNKIFSVDSQIPGGALVFSVDKLVHCQIPGGALVFGRGTKVGESWWRGCEEVVQSGRGRPRGVAVIQPQSIRRQAICTQHLPGREAICTQHLPGREAICAQLLPGREAICTQLLPGREAICTQHLRGREAVCTQHLPGKKQFDGRLIVQVTSEETPLVTPF